MTTSASISGAVGERKGSPNRVQDVTRVQQWLHTALGGAPAGASAGVCDATTIAAIKTFQQAWGGVGDGTVDPGGGTLARLQRMANPLRWKSLTKKRVVDGGYRLHFSTCDNAALPPAGSDWRIYLGVLGERNLVDLTGRNPNDPLDPPRLAELLNIIERLDAWARPMPCRLYVRYRDLPVSVSEENLTLTCPVRPHNGSMLPLDEANNGAKLTYQGDATAESFYGRMFARIPGYDKQLFIWAGLFETDPEHRGFDCITYAGTTCGAKYQDMGGTPKGLADALGAAAVEWNKATIDPASGKKTEKKIKLEDADPADVRAFFGEAPVGHFLLCQSGHIVIVTGGFVYEFRASQPAGYNRTAVADWLAPYKTKKLSVRQLKDKPVLAV